jgi:hypothetical protein
MASKISIVEAETFEQSDSIAIPPSDIIAYNELRSCADLFRMHTDGILEIQPVYERDIVWNDAAQTRFIDSLIKQLPIPSMCFSLDYKKEKFQVIDGLQRMSTIIRFLKGSKWTLSALEDIDPKISGRPVSDFFDRKSPLHFYYTRIENMSLPVTILRCDYSKESNREYIFMIFHRLNSGGAKLTNQEIRNCIYSGPFNDLLKELNHNTHWMSINGMKRTFGYRFRKEEIILRFFALYDNSRNYEGKLSVFLNKYMSKYRNSSKSFLSKKRVIFNRTVEIINKDMFEGKSPHLSSVVLESILVGVALNIDYIEKQAPSDIKRMYAKLLDAHEFSLGEIIEGIARKEKVIGRISTAKRIFSGK